MKRNKNEIPRTGLFGVLMVSMALIAMEITLTRIFSVTLWYHFSNIVISLALLGFAGAAFYIAKKPSSDPRLSAYSALAGAVLCILGTYAHLSIDLVGYDIRSASLWVCLVVQGAIFIGAFFFIGLSLCNYLILFKSHFGLVYSFDLFGAALGAALIISALWLVSAPAAVILIAATLVFASFLFSIHFFSKRESVCLISFVLLLVLLSLINDQIGFLQVKRVKSYSSTHLQETEGNKIYEKWNPLSRITVEDHQNPRNFWVQNDGGAQFYIWKFDGDWPALRQSRIVKGYNHSVFATKEAPDVLVIGSAGGKDVLASLSWGARKVTAIEINPATAELVTKVFKTETGDIFHDPRVDFHVSEARHYIGQDKQKYDIIQISVADSLAGSVAGAYMFQENYLYTTEAFAEYMTHLKSGGTLSFSRHIVNDELAKLVYLALEYLSGKGVAHPEKHILILAEKDPSKNLYTRGNLLAKNEEFSEAEVSKVKEFVSQQEKKVGLIYNPLAAVSDEEIAPDRKLQQLISIYNDKAKLNEFLRAPEVSIWSPTDDRPFFFFNVKARDIGDIFTPDPKGNPARRLAIPLLFGLVLAVGIFLVASIFLAKGKSESWPTHLISSNYFVCISLGFMFFEMPTIQKYILFLGHPIYAMAFVLSTLLLSLGVGSFFADRMKYKNFIGAELGLTVIITLSSLWTLPNVYGWWASLVGVFHIGLVGLLMGFCLPFGIKFFSKNKDLQETAYFWGINGLASVLGINLAFLIALYYGFRATQLISALWYLTAIFTIIYCQNRLNKQFKLQS